MYKLVVVVAAGLALAGCGGTIFSLAVDPPGKTRDYFLKCLQSNRFLPDSANKASASEVAARLTEGIVPTQYAPASNTGYTIEAETGEIEALRRQPGYVNRFLDCYVAPVRATDLKGRLLRGQIVAALLAQYASATLIAKERATKPDDAATIIFHIRRAALHLMSVSPEALESLYLLRKEDIPLKSRPGPAAARDLAALVRLSLPNFHNAQRTAAVFDIGTDIARIDGRFVTNTAGTIFDVVSTTAVSGGFNPSVVPKLQGLVEAAVAGLSLAAQSQWYGSAFIRDAQESLLVDMSDTRNIGLLWLAWQSRINAACESLKAVTDTRAKPCEPTAIEMADYIKREYPGHPYLDALQERAALDIRKK